MKRTYQPKIRRRVRVHGFRRRMKTQDGRNVLKSRHAKGRHQLAVTKNAHVKKVNWNGAKATAYRIGQGGYRGQGLILSMC